MATDRYMCMGCGRFWNSDRRPTMCPYCADGCYCDNIVEGAPPKISNVRIDFPCGHCMSTDIGLDVKYCPVCGNPEKKYFHEGEYFSLKNWQLQELERLGL